MRRHLFGITLAVVLGAAVGPVSSQGIMLAKEVADELPEEAKVHYDLACELNDRVNYDEAIIELSKAAELAPDSEKLQFLTAVRARYRAEIYYSAASYSPPPENMPYSSPPWRTSEQFYDIAQSSLQRLLTHSSLNDEEQERLQNELELLDTRRAALSERDRKRLETAQPLVLDIQALRREGMKVGLFSDFEPTDPAAPYLTKIQRQREQEREEKAKIQAQEDGLLATNPFSTLPGEWKRPAIPTPLPPQLQQQQQGGFEGGRDPFAEDPAISAGGFDPAAARADPAFGGGK